MHVTGVGWVEIMTENLESTLRFFTEMLGVSLVYHDEAREIAHFRFRIK
jgi:catechol 2,3-dioxygenase-like lactoylglutathione lyase family enzyme